MPRLGGSERNGAALRIRRRFTVDVGGWSLAFAPSTLTFASARVLPIDSVNRATVARPARTPSPSLDPRSGPRLP